MSRCKKSVRKGNYPVVSNGATLMYLPGRKY